MELVEQMSDPKPIIHTSFWRLRMGERQLLLVFGDLVFAIISLLVSLVYWGISERFIGLTQEFFQRRVPGWFYFLPIIWVLLMVELYDVHRASDLGKTIRGIAIAALIGFMLYLLLYFYYSVPPKSLLPRRGVASFLVVASLLSLVWRYIYIKVFTGAKFMRRVLLIGGGNNGRLFMQTFNSLKSRPFLVVGIVDDDPQKIGQEVESVPIIGDSTRLNDLIEENHISDLIVAIGGEMQPATFKAILEAQERGVEIIRMPIAYEELVYRVPVVSLEADWILRTFVDQTRGSGFYEVAKRLLDILGALVGLLIMLLILPFIALLMLFDDGFPVFYGQTRSGRGGLPYEILKFRTMRRDAEKNGQPQWATEQDSRATRVGRLLRKTHLDELPQFVNVLRGDMSLVGPRAERPELVELFQKKIPFYRARLLVKPGITGWAQVNFGYAATVEETTIKLEYDLYYIKRRSIFLDLLILLRTPATVFGMRGR